MKDDVSVPETSVPEASVPWKRTLTIVVFAQMMTAVGFSSIFPFLPLYVDALGARSGLSVEVLAGLVYSAQAFTMMLASPVWGALADRYGRKLMVQRAMFGGAVLLFLMALVRSAEELVLLRGMQGGGDGDGGGVECVGGFAGAPGAGGVRDGVAAGGAGDRDRVGAAAGWVDCGRVWL